MKMDKANEQYLWDRITFLGEGELVFPRTVIEEMLEKKMINSPKQAWCTLEKWSDRGVYDYGVSIDLGWKYHKQDDMPFWEI